jgi:hypothetical protein
MSLLVHICMARHPYGMPVQQDEKLMPYWQNEALIQFEKLTSDILREFGEAA